MPKTIQWVVKLFCIFLVVFSLFRLSTYFIFKPKEISFFNTIPSFLLGLRFDVRWVCFILLPIIVVSYIPKFSPYASKLGKKIWVAYLTVITILLMFFFGADYGHFAYVSTRLNASALNFMQDFSISIVFLWQSYPLFWILLGLMVLGYLFFKLYKKTHQKTQAANALNTTGYQHKKWYTTITLLMLLGVYGTVTVNPLKHKDAFEFKNNFKTYLALNPLQNFFTTLGWRKPVFDVGKKEQAFTSIAQFLQLDSNSIYNQSYQRNIADSNTRITSTKPNIVLVVCESFSMYKSSMSGNPLNATPYFNNLAKQGIFFNKCFTPHFATARGLFAILTGIPDVQLSIFSTQNKESLNQNTIVNSFTNYNKFYFIGGSSGFNNYKGLISNIHNVQIFDESKFDVPKLNIWGISDKNLFAQANKVFAKQSTPFFAIIQTAHNHRPYTIPKEDTGFKQKQYPIDTLKKYGFISNKEFNAFAYTDYVFKQFIENAQKEKFFNNTIFVFVGDHGVEGNAKFMYPNVYTDARLSDEHVPFLLYAPKLFAPQLHTQVVSQIDVLPTIAGLANQPYTNTTLGRDVLNKHIKNNGAFIINHDEGKIAWVTDSFYYSQNIRFNQDELLPLNSNKLTCNPQQATQIKKQTSQFVNLFYETAKWMLVHNKQK